MKTKSTNRYLYARAAMLLMLLFTTVTVWAQTPRAMAIYCDENKTLYFTSRVFEEIDEVLPYNEDHTSRLYIPEGSSEPIIATFSERDASVTATGTNYPGWITEINYNNYHPTTVVIESSFANVRPTSCANWFLGISTLTDIQGIENLNTSEVTNMSYMFASCPALTRLDLSGFDTGKVTDMSLMFSQCSNLVSIIIGDGWDTTSVTSSNMMFYNCTSIIGYDGTTYSVGKWDKTCAHAGTGGYMCKQIPYAVYSAANQTLYFTNPIHLVAAGGTFTPEGSNTAQTVTSVWSGTDLTASGEYPGWISGTNIYTSVTHVVIEPTFSSLKPASTKRWFRDFHQLSSIQGLSNLNTSEVTDMEAMFSGCSQLTSLDLIHFNTDNVENMASMFGSCSELTTLDLSSFNMEKVTETAYMFKNCSNLIGINIPSNLKVIGASAFENCATFTGITIPASVTRIGSSAFTGCTHLTDIYYDGTQTRWNAVTKGSNWKPSATTEHWRCTVSFDTNGHGTAPAAQDNLWSNEDKATRPADPSAEGYVFTGTWYVDAACATEWDFDDIVPGDMTLHAGWETILYFNDGTTNDLTTYDGQRYSVTLQGRTLYTDGDWNTLCLPFDVDDFDGTPLEGFTVKELDTEIENDGHKTGFDSGTLYLNFKDAVNIEAGKPYIVKKFTVKEGAATPTFTAKDGTAGSQTQQGYANLIDGNTGGNMWRTSVVPAYCEFYADQPVYVTGYTLTTGSQNVNGDPTMWMLSVSADGNEPWTVIDRRNVNNSTADALPSGRTTTSDVYNVQKSGTYQYFRFDVKATAGNSFLCLSELTLQACYPSDIANIENPLFESVTISSAEPTAVTSEDGAVSFSGNYNPVSIGNEGDKSILFMGAENTLYYPNAAMNINSFRAYFQLNNGLVCGNPSQGGDGINAFVLNFGDGSEATTGIVDADFKSASQESGISNPLQQGWSSLDGRMLSGKPTQKGIYINNGKKFIIK